MPGNLTTAHANTLLASSIVTGDKLALVTVGGSKSSAGTEVTGGSYARQSITAGTASAGSIASTAALNFTAMPACTLQGWEIWDSAGSNRKWFGVFSSKTGTAQTSGNTITIASHGYTTGQKVVFQSGYAPAGASAGTTYYVAGTVTTNTFQISTTSGGSVLTITADSALVAVGVAVDVASGATFTINSGSLVDSLT